MSARLRILPIFTRDEGQAQHYLILDGLQDLPGPLQDQDVDKLEALAAKAGGVAITFGFQVDLPEVDEDPEGAWAEMVRAEHAREMAYKAEHWEADPDNPGAVREREDAWLPEGYAREDVLALIRRQEASVETEPAPVCKASREVEASGWVICDGQGHDREHHSGRLTTGPSVGNRYAWPFGPSDRAKPAEPQPLVFTVNVENVHPLDLGHRVLMELREHARVTARRA